MDAYEELQVRKREINEFDNERDAIASRLLAARFDNTIPKIVSVVKVGSNITIEYPSGTELISKDLEGIPEVLRIVYGSNSELIYITHTKDNLILQFKYGLVGLIDYGI